MKSLILLLLMALNGFSEVKKTDNKNGEAISIYYENDTRGVGGPGSDQAYTSGLKFSYVYAESKIPDWARDTVERYQLLDEKNPDDTKINLAVSLGHQMFTPKDLGATELIPDDRPYAGWLYLGFAANLKEKKSAHIFEFDIGMVGPSALGRQIQNSVHDRIPKQRGMGWHNGLKDEPTLQFYYQKRFKIVESKNVDLLPFYGVALGNVNIGGHFGGMVRFGSDLLDDFGPSRPSSNDGDSFISPMNIDEPQKFSYYLFASARGNLVARNIFLDGNTFQDSHRVRKHLFNFDTEVGVCLQKLPFHLVWRVVMRSPEFQERNGFIGFGSVNFVYFL
jgi:lipid A 3-O-deacylase